MNTSKYQLSDGSTWTAVQSLTHKHPNGGSLRIVGNCHSGEFFDTRKINGKRRSKHGVVYQCGTRGWCVVYNPGENAIVKGYYKTETAYAAWELADAGLQMELIAA